MSKIEKLKLKANHNNRIDIHNQFQLYVKDRKAEIESKSQHNGLLIFEDAYCMSKIEKLKLKANHNKLIK